MPEYATSNVTNGRINNNRLRHVRLGSGEIVRYRAVETDRGSYQNIQGICQADQMVTPVNRWHPIKRLQIWHNIRKQFGYIPHLRFEKEGRQTLLPYWEAVKKDPSIKA